MSGTCCQVSKINLHFLAHYISNIIITLAEMGSVTWIPSQRMCSGKDPSAAKDIERRRNIRESHRFFFFGSPWLTRHGSSDRGLRSRDLNLIKLSGAWGRQRKKDHEDKRGRDRRRGKERTLQMTGDVCALSDSSGQRGKIFFKRWDTSSLWEE